ncbi:Hypothetical_protein [Hexamita inflata]|uniref:Hypothetical_protein n=1 Tax=Hexamita inflata TaxID=28002 RepID=A0AA86U0Q1_9EUKA|nr:Hypothetical protein HINF_LOCUS23386 [Hexamita inflata]
MHRALVIKLAQCSLLRMESVTSGRNIVTYNLTMHMVTTVHQIQIIDCLLRTNYWLFSLFYVGSASIGDYSTVKIFLTRQFIYKQPQNGYQVLKSVRNLRWLFSVIIEDRMVLILVLRQRYCVTKFGFVEALVIYEMVQCAQNGQCIWIRLLKENQLQIFSITTSALPVTCFYHLHYISYLYYLHKVNYLHKVKFTYNPFCSSVIDTFTIKNRRCLQVKRGGCLNSRLCSKDQIRAHFRLECFWARCWKPGGILFVFKFVF